MNDLSKITVDQWVKIFNDMKADIICIPIGKNAGWHDVWKTTLPRGMRGLSLQVSKRKAVIFYSNRFYAEPSIVEIVKHEIIHLELGNGRHGKEFKRLCLVYGLNPNKHA